MTDAIEILFVDSASSDMSVQLAQQVADEVLALEQSPNLCASAGRHVGTTQAKGTWILYLDADMVVDPEFISFIADRVEERDTSCGWVGERRDIYPSGGMQSNAQDLGKRGDVVRHFGGAVLLRREAVIRAGNWNPRVFSNEEIDLYTRLRAIGCKVKSSGTPMVDHYTENPPPMEKLRGLLVGGPSIGKKYYGIGQVLAARRTVREFASLVRYFPYPFVFWGTILVGGVLWFSNLRRASVLVMMSGMACVWKEKGPQFIVVYAAFAPQAALGFRRYDAEYVPSFRSIRGRGSA